mmetsp:Transcript_23620/g.33140  ORF Transcript_23620/g.33140 Transcript_23620/m.33140 type:complete len:338 (-) Transcript_23620:63-1076(-)
MPTKSSKKVPASINADGRSVARTRLSKYSTELEQRKKAERDRKAKVVPALAARSYHLEGNSFCEDWFQYFMNNHPIFGICCHHKYHPVGFAERIVALIGSLAFGLAITNIFFLSFIFTDEEYQEAIISVSINKNASATNVFSDFKDQTISDDDKTTDDNTLVVTYGMILLWTVGGGMHSCFDLSVWYISACACCHPGGMLESCGSCKKMGSVVMVVLIAVVVAISTFIAVLRASIESSDEEISISNITSGGINDDVVDLGKIQGVESFEFVLTFMTEMLLAYIVYFPLLGTILFTGVLGCGRVPFLGGRPREVWKENEKLRKQQRDDNTVPQWEDLA